MNTVLQAFRRYNDQHVQALLSRMTQGDFADLQRSPRSEQQSARNLALAIRDGIGAAELRSRLVQLGFPEEWSKPELVALSVTGWMDVRCGPRGRFMTGPAVQASLATVFPELLPLMLVGQADEDSTDDEDIDGYLDQEAGDQDEEFGDQVAGDDDQRPERGRRHRRKHRLQMIFQPCSSTTLAVANCAVAGCFVGGAASVCWNLTGWTSKTIVSALASYTFSGSMTTLSVQDPFAQKSLTPPFPPFTLSWNSIGFTWINQNANNAAANPGNMVFYGIGTAPGTNSVAQGVLTVNY